MRRRKLLDDVVYFDESLLVRCCWHSILRRENKGRHEDESRRENRSQEHKSVTSRTSSENPGCESKRCADITVWPHALTPSHYSPAASMATSKNIYWVFWDDSAFYSKSHTHFLAAFIMTGCVKYNAMISGVSMFIISFWQTPAQEVFVFFSVFSSFPLQLKAQQKSASQNNYDVISQSIECALTENFS